MDPYKVRWTPDDLWPLLTLIMAPPFVLLLVMLLVHTNYSCRYKRLKRVQPRHIRLTKIVIFDDNLCKITPKLAVILFWPFQLIVCSIPSN